MKKAFMLLVAAAAGLGVTAQTFKQGIKLTAGSKYDVVTTIKGNMTQEMMGQSMEIPMESVTNSKLEVKAKSAAGYEAASTNTRITFSASVMGQEMAYDSDKKEDREGKMGATMNKMVGTPTTFTVNEGGHILPETVVKPAKEKEEGQEDMMASMMSNMGAGMSSTSPAFDVFANSSELKVGDSFTEPVVSEVKEGASTKGSTTYTLADIKDGFARFTFTGTINSENKTQMQGMDMTVVTAAKSSGDLLVDLASGLLSQKTILVETTGNVEVQGMTIPLTGKTNITINVKAAQ